MCVYVGVCVGVNTFKYFQGASLHIFRRIDDNWFEGTTACNNIIGLIPISYVDPAEQFCDIEISSLQISNSQLRLCINELSDIAINLTL